MSSIRATKFLGGLILAAVAMLATGCQSPSGNDLDRPRESSIPWNKPQSWEGPGVLGNSMPGAGM